uniref:WRKY domain-containing protein n=1 Tax=Brassica oleracea var. oleracea TaxID=109376 RepID=A0A0D3BM41_BRAOL
MDDKDSCEADVYAAAETEKGEKVDPEKELCHGDDDGLSQLRGEESLTNMEGLPVRETLAKDHVEDVRENSSVEPNREDVKEQISDSRVVSNLSVSPVLRTPAHDGYHWRKYGQKRVKSPRGSRSYYRCTYSDCCAKKIECSNDSGNVIEIVNKGSHSHEPLRKNSFSPRETRAASVIPPVTEDNTVVPTGSALSISTKENVCQSLAIVEGKRNCENEAVEEPEPKRRLKKSNSQSSDTVSKPGKKHKVVVHAAGDVGISGDGYRWRKYGQKMVKGNPNPRNYYRCTSAGCSVRKHIETAVENRTAVVITYKGVHNHDMPVPKKRHGPPSSALVAAAAPTSMRTRLEDQVNIPTSGQCSVGRESEKQSSEGVDVGGGEKVMESARTLLSIGFEIKQC